MQFLALHHNNLVNDFKYFESNLTSRKSLLLSAEERHRLNLLRVTVSESV